MIKIILVPVDGSPNAERATDAAAEIAEKFGARIELLFVQTDAPLPEALKHMAEVEYVGAAVRPAVAAVPEGRFPASITPGQRPDADILQRVAEAVLDQAASKIRRSGGDVVSTLADGDPAECILERAGRGDIDLIVLGSRGLGRLQGLLMGSVSSKVSQLAPCNCMTVK